MDCLIEAPDQKTQRGRRDRTLLLFPARTGARVSEAIGVNAADLTLDSLRPQVLLRGKGRKERIVPISHDRNTGKTGGKSDFLLAPTRFVPIQALCEPSGQF
jgi:site-specific recombinase XerD